MTDGTSPQIKKRRVFYIPGYDPFPPRRYRELYRSEAEEQAKISGYDISLFPNSKEGPFGWTIHSVIDDQTCDTEFSVLVWADIVRGSMEKGVLATYLLMLRTAWVYISTGALFRLMRLRKGPVIAALYPVVFLIAQLAIAVAVFAALFHVIEMVAPAWLGWAAIGVVPLILHWFKRHDNKVFAYYLMHDYAFSAATNGRNAPALQGRMAEFEALIRQALDTEVDEVLVVGHSSGAHIAVSVLAKLLRQGLPDHAPKIGFLSLGQVVPMVSFLPEAHDLRRDLVALSEQDQIFWLDVTAPGDGCAFALCDPVAVSGLASAGQKHPLVISAAFTQTLSEAKWRALRWRFFRLHFQYLCAFDRPGDYDYFKITAGPQSLAERFQGRPPSKSRRVDAVNRYTSVAQ